MASIIWEMRRGPLAVIEFDAVTSETHTVEAEVTEHPIEVGANVSDHSRPKLRVVSTEVVITNTPVNETTVGDMFPIGAILMAKTPVTITHLTRQRVTGSSLVGGWVAPWRFPGTPRPAGMPQALEGITSESQVSISGSAWQSLSQVDRVKECYDVLVALCLTGRQVRYVTDLQEYSAMSVLRVGVARRAEDAIRCQLELKEVRYASTKEVDIVKKKPKEKRGEVEVSEGSKATYADAQMEDRGRTLMARGALLGIF